MSHSQQVKQTIKERFPKVEKCFCQYSKEGRKLVLNVQYKADRPIPRELIENVMREFQSADYYYAIQL